MSAAHTSSIHEDLALRARVIEHDLKVTGLSRKKLAAQYLRAAARDERNAVRAVEAGGYYRNWSAEWYVEAAKLKRLLARDCLAEVRS